MSFSIHLIRPVRTLALLGALAGVAAPVGAASGRPSDVRAGAAAVKAAAPDAFERAVQRAQVAPGPDVFERAVQRAQVAPVPDVFERTVLRAEARPASDVLERAAQRAQATQSVRNGLGPLDIAGPALVPVSGGAAFHWGDWAIGLLAGLGLALGLAGVLLLVTHRASRPPKTGVAAAG